MQLGHRHDFRTVFSDMDSWNDDSGPYKPDAPCKVVKPTSQHLTTPKRNKTEAHFPFFLGIKVTLNPKPQTLNPKPFSKSLKGFPSVLGGFRRFFKGCNSLLGGVDLSRRPKNTEKQMCLHEALCKHICLPRALGGLTKAKKGPKSFKLPVERVSQARNSNRV